MSRVTFTIRLVLAGVGLVMTVLGGVAYAQGGTPPVVELGKDVWIVVAGGLVTVGINLQQLRQTRVDIKDLKSGFDHFRTKQLPDEYVRRDYWLLELAQIKDTVERIEERMP